MEYLNEKPDDAGLIGYVLHTGVWDPTITPYELLDYFWGGIWLVCWIAPLFFFFYLRATTFIRIRAIVSMYPFIVFFGFFGFDVFWRQGIIPSLLYNLMGADLFFTVQAVVFNYFTLYMFFI